MSTRLFIFVGMSVFLAFGGAASASEHPDVLQALSEKIDVTEFTKKQRTLSEALKIFQEICRRNGAEVQFEIDVNGFKEEDPDAPELMNTQIVQLTHARKTMVAAHLLRWILSQVETGNATFVVRRSIVKITTYQRANPANLLAGKIVAAFNGRSLRRVIDQLSEESGVTMILDQSIGTRVNTPIFAAFRNDVTYWYAVHAVAHTAGLRVVTLERGLFITTPDRAEALTRQLYVQQIMRIRYSYMRGNFAGPDGPTRSVDPLN